MRPTHRLIMLGLLIGLLGLGLPALPAWAAGAGEPSVSRGQLEADAGAWRPWLLSSGSQFRLPPPPDKQATRDELRELERLAARRDAAALDRIRYWDAGAPGYRWNVLAVQHQYGKPRPWRNLALLNVAIADATIAAWDTKYAYRRPRPAEFERGFQTALPAPASPAYPSEHAVTAGAAEAVLSYLFPADAATFSRWADEAGQSRLLAGADYPSDVAAGRELGRQVAAVVIAWAKADGSDARWDGAMPSGPDIWTPAPNVAPIEPLAGAWTPWTLTSGSQFRSGPRAAHDSPELRAELDTVKSYPRTNLTNLTASYWEYYGSRGAHDYWSTSIGRRLFEERLDGNPPRAARVYALVQVAAADAFIACWDAKYAYWAARPAQLDPAITTVFVTPNHPSYPSGHGCVSGAVGTVLGALFPREAGYYNALIAEISESRIAGGIHVRSDQVAGEAIGRAVAGVVLARAGADGAD
jgi:membrane-associated phospholipid phosphatase